MCAFDVIHYQVEHVCPSLSSSVLVWSSFTWLTVCFCVLAAWRVQGLRTACLWRRSEPTGSHSGAAGDFPIANVKSVTVLAVIASQNGG